VQCFCGLNCFNPQGTTGDVSHFLSMSSHGPMKMSKTVNTAHTNKILIGRQGADVTHAICNPERRATSLITCMGAFSFDASLALHCSCGTLDQLLSRENVSARNSPRIENSVTLC